jgi:DNA-binding helix-hairpin-helix protein with protein kinase domain
MLLGVLSMEGLGVTGRANEKVVCFIFTDALEAMPRIQAGDWIPFQVLQPRFDVQSVCFEKCVSQDLRPDAEALIGAEKIELTEL